MATAHAPSHAHRQHRHAAGAGPYARFAVMMALSFLAMYALMYSMVDAWDNVLPSLNKAYMAVLMTAPMAIFELALMGRMYPSRKANAAIIAAAVLALAVFFAFIRAQVGINDRHFLQSMIPHHSAALLMCRKAPVGDREIVQLCKSIVASQQREIDEMKQILARLHEAGRS